MSEEKTPDELRIKMIAPGVILIVFGILLLIGFFIPNILSISKLWPLFMMIPCVLFISQLFQYGRKAEGVLVPLVIITGLTVYFLWLNYTSWSNVSNTWPTFILLPGLGLLALYFSNQRTALLIPVSILVVLSIVFYGVIFNSSIFIGIIFILIGGLVIARPFFKEKKSEIKIE